MFQEDVTMMSNQLQRVSKLFELISILNRFSHYQFFLIALIRCLYFKEVEK